MTSPAPKTSAAPPSATACSGRLVGRWATIAPSQTTSMRRPPCVAIVLAVVPRRARTNHSPVSEPRPAATMTSGGGTSTARTKDTALDIYTFVWRWRCRGN